MTTETPSLAAACLEAALMCERRSQEEQRDGRDGRIPASPPLCENFSKPTRTAD